MIFFRLNTWLLLLGLAVVMVSATLAGLAFGRRVGRRSSNLREPFGILQGALIGFMGLVLAFGLSLAVGRYESRRGDVVTEANAIGTTYLRAQTLPEPIRTESLALLRSYTDTSITLATTVPGSAGYERELAKSNQYQNRLWALAGQALNDLPEASAPRLYVETLNEMFDAQSVRVHGATNRVPTAVLILEVTGAAVAIAALALHLGTFDRPLPTVLIVALLVTLLLGVTFDLDRPVRGLIRVPASALVDERAAMSTPPAASAPTHR
jgi:hypothetical protein